MESSTSDPPPPPTDGVPRTDGVALAPMEASYTTPRSNAIDTRMRHDDDESIDTLQRQQPPPQLQQPQLQLQQSQQLSPPLIIPVWVRVLEWVHDYLQTLIQTEYQKSREATSTASTTATRTTKPTRWWTTRATATTAASLCLLPVVAAILLSASGRSLLQSALFWWLRQLSMGVRTTIGTVVGVALGLGWASHVYDQLDVWEQRQQRQEQQQHQQEWGVGEHGQYAYHSAKNNNIKNAAGMSLSFPSMPSRQRLSSSSTRALSTGKSARTVVRYPDSHSGMHGATVEFGTATTVAVASSTRTMNLQDEQTYASLMASAGYHLVRHHHTTSSSDRSNASSPPMAQLVRGQVMRSDQVPRDILYPLFDSTAQWKAVVVMQDLWPTLPAPVTAALGKAVELILRDYIAAWYCKVDPGCRYLNGGTSRTVPSSLSPPLTRVMLYSVAVYKPLPFYDSLYESCAIVFGNLATRVEHVNVFELLLLKWTRILAHTFKTYRALRKNVKPSSHSRQKASSPEKQQSIVLPSVNAQSAVEDTAPTLACKKAAPSRRGLRIGEFSTTTVGESPSASLLDDGSHGYATAAYAPVSEIAMTKEFLFAGKLHKAVTFGLDVPSFLFTDPNGKECGKPRKTKDGPIVLEKCNDEEPDDRQFFTDDDVLTARLFETNVITDCEVDYNRVLGHRMVRALVSRADFGSAIVSSILTEIMAGCVLTPIMSLFAPETLNSWIIAGLATKPTDTTAATNETHTTKKAVDNSVDSVAFEATGNSRNDVLKQSRSTDGTNKPFQAADEGELSPDKIEVVFGQDRDLPRQNATIDCGNADGMHASNLSPGETSLDHESTIVFNSPIATVTNNIETYAVTSDQPLNNTFRAESDLASPSPLEGIVMILVKTLIDLQEFVDFEEFRLAKANKQSLSVAWDDPGCRAAVIRLVLVVEAALTHGRCAFKEKIDEDEDEGENDLATGEDQLDDNGSERPVEVTLPQYESTTFTQLLMELTNNLDAFEVRVASDNALLQDKVASQFEHMISLPYKQSVTDQSTLRTLIAVWLHSGQLYKALSLLVQANATILTPFYHKSAFLRSKADTNEFARQLRSLDRVEITVDTMYVQASPRLQDLKEEDFQTLIQRSVRSTSISSPPPSPPTKTMFFGNGISASSILSAQFMTPSSTPRYLDFNRNETFAASLRSERERRLQSWGRTMVEVMEEGVPIVHRKRGTTDEDKAAHVELHHIAKIFFAGTNMLALRDAGRRPNIEPSDAEGVQSVQSSVGAESGDPFALLLVETACPKRRIEVPDDDSSFLLRAQPRPLNAVGVHRDQRNHDQSFKCFAATYDEPVLNVTTDKQNGGRYIRRCLIRYYPIDRTASVALQNDVRKLDQRKYLGSVPSTITLGRVSRTAPFLSADFLKERHLCNRLQQKGSTKPQSILSSSVMEATDFTSWPRPGKAIEFVYRMTFFERPGLDLGGKRFTVADAAALGAHRADASALEMSDASLSFALLTMEPDDGRGETCQRRQVEMGRDGYPVIWMKFSRNQDDAQVELKQYRTSFVRAALLLTAARHEAQLRCLVHCVKAGSAKKATKALTDSYLKPTLRLIEYAGSPSREKQSILLRDLKLGVTHLDRSQLRRNALLSPRFPTELIDLNAVVEDVVDGPDSKGVDLFGGSNSFFTIKCTAIVALVATDEELIGDLAYQTEAGMLAETYKEEWVVHRTMKELQTFHKHLKMQVSMTESSGTAGSRLVGAATAAFSTTISVGKIRQRKMLIPSLTNASKTGSIGATKKLKLKHKETFDGYFGYMLAPGHLLGRCSELLLFLGASFPLSPEVRTGGEAILSHSDPLGRTAMSRSALRLRAVMSPLQHRVALADDDGPDKSLSPPPQRLTSIEPQDDDLLMDEDDGGSGDFISRKNNALSSNMIPAVTSKIDKVLLSQVRNRIFELLRYQFGFENASFARNRLLAALKTASFAVTTPTEFRKLLYKLHTDHLNSEAVSGWIHFLIDTLWPKGIFFESQAVPPREEFQVQSIQAKDLLHKSFPDQVRAILGQDLTRDGMDIFHEMLQNRLVVKSMAYMLFDLLWLEIFPEIGDVLSCGAALDIADTQT